MGSLAIVPAAGAAERFGSAKLLADIKGRPLLDHTIQALLDGGVDRVIAVLGAETATIRAGVKVLGDARVSIATNDHPELGMFSSIQAGLRAASGDPILVLPGDMPFVNAETAASLLRLYRERPSIISPRFRGKRGHPIALPGTYRDEILEAPPTVTLHEIVKAHASERVDMDVYDRGVVRDIDVPSDLQAEAAP
jgi:molybdenum cofactor cytidylyltransferase